MAATTPEALFADRLRADPSRPFVTYYDEATGERSELSVKSLANWVAKTHHLFTGELDLGVGDTAQLRLPAHWLSVAVLLGALSAGLRLSTDADAQVAVSTPAELPASAGVPDIYVISPERAAFGLSDPPAGTLDLVAAVRPQPDAWATVGLLAGPEDPFDRDRSRAATIAAAQQGAAMRGWAPGDRILVTRDWSGPADWIDTVLAPLVLGGSVVFVRNAPDAATLERRRDQERCTQRLD